MEPILSFAILLAVILIVPICFERLQLPGLIGLLASGVVLGSDGLKLLNPESETMYLLSGIGVIYLMFVAGLEMEMEEFMKVRNRAIGFGILTFSLPLIVGTAIGYFFNFSWNASFLIGSLLSSHTPLGYPILSRLGLMRNEAVIVTIGGTIFTNIPALLVLAVCVGVHGGELTLWSLVRLLLSVIVYAVVTLLGLEWAGREFFRRSGDEEGNQFLFILLAVFVAAVSGQLVGVEKIVGAFLAGMAVNGVMGASPVKEKVVFVGSVLFIPIFMVNLGLLIDLPAFVKTLSSFWFTLALVLGLMASKWVAAWLTQQLYHYTQAETIAIWSLSIPQVAATLAATLVGYNTLNSMGERLLSEDVVNSVIVMMLVTATLGPYITARVASKLEVSQPNLENAIVPFVNPADATLHPQTIVVPVYNPDTEQYLVEMAALLLKGTGGRMVPLSVIRMNAHTEETELQAALKAAEDRLALAIEYSRSLGVCAEPLLRIDHDIAQGISHASLEQHASLIVMGWRETTSLQSRLFGTTIDRLLWVSRCPVAVTRLLESPQFIQYIWVLLDHFIDPAILPVWFACTFSSTNPIPMHILLTCPVGTPAQIEQSMRDRLAQLCSEFPSSVVEMVSFVPPGAGIEHIIKNSSPGHLVIWHSQRYPTMTGSTPDDRTAEMLARLQCSIAILTEP